MPYSSPLSIFSTSRVHQFRPTLAKTHFASWFFETWALLFSLCFLGSNFESSEFPSKMVPCRFSLDLPIFGLWLSSKPGGSIYGSHPIGLLYLIGPQLFSFLPIPIHEPENMECVYKVRDYLTLTTWGNHCGWPMRNNHFLLLGAIW